MVEESQSPQGRSTVEVTPDEELVRAIIETIRRHQAPTTSLTMFASLMAAFVLGGREESEAMPLFLALMDQMSPMFGDISRMGFGQKVTTTGRKLS